MNYVYEMPKEMLTECTNKGTVELFEYTSETYDDSHRKLNKRAYVYLPYGYDKSQSYNILYLLHGGGFMQEWWE